MRLRIVPSRKLPVGEAARYNRIFYGRTRQLQTDGSLDNGKLLRQPIGGQLHAPASIKVPQGLRGSQSETSITSFFSTERRMATVDSTNAAGGLLLRAAYGQFPLGPAFSSTSYAKRCPHRS